MNKLQLGKMYLVKEYCWFLYPTKELASTTGSRWSSVRRWPSDDGRTAAYQDAIWLSQRYKCNVGVVEPKTSFVLLEQDKDHFKVLDSNGIVGWIRSDDFSIYIKVLNEKKNDL